MIDWIVLVGVLVDVGVIVFVGVGVIEIGLDVGVGVPGTKSLLTNNWLLSMLDIETPSKLTEPCALAFVNPKLSNGIVESGVNNPTCTAWFKSVSVTILLLVIPVHEAIL